MTSSVYLRYDQPWIEEFKPAMRVTLDALQGKWTNSQHQDITIEGDQCTFADGNPVQISPYDTATYSTYSVPGWVLSQDHSHPNTVRCGLACESSCSAQRADFRRPGW